MSAIDPTKPVYGNPTTQSVRDNFATAKAEIEDLDSRKLDKTAATSTYLPLAGGTMTGLLTLSADPSTVLHAATKGYVDTKAGGYLPLAGGTMQGPLTLSGAPTVALHAATKAYVDGFLPLAGGTLTGSLNINGGVAVVGVNATVGAEVRVNGTGTRNLHFQTAGVSRWRVATNATAEGSGNAGSDFEIRRYNDAGTQIDIPLGINRATGAVALTSALTVGGNLNITGTTTLSADPTVALGAATKAYVDTKAALYLPLAGGILTGLLTLSGAPTANLHAATKQYVDQQIVGATGVPEAPTDGKTYGRGSSAWSAVLPIAGGTLTGALTLAADPTVALHAATRQYVDGRDALYLPLAGGTLTGALQIVDPSASAVFSLSVSAANSASGAGIRLIGNGATTPNKYIRAINGLLQVVNSAYGAVIWSMSDTGATQFYSAMGLGGTTTPADALAGAIRFPASGYIGPDGSQQTLDLASNAYQSNITNTPWKYLTAATAAVMTINGPAASFGFYTAATGAVGGTVTWTQRATIDSTGLAVASNGTISTGGELLAGFIATGKAAATVGGFVGSWRADNNDYQGMWSGGGVLNFGFADLAGNPTVLYASLDKSGNFTAAGSITACNIANFGLYKDTGNGRYLRFGNNAWGFQFDNSNGTLSYQNGTSAVLASISGGGAIFAASTIYSSGILYCNGSYIQSQGSSYGLRCTSGDRATNNTFNFGWYTMAAGSVHASIDNGAAAVAFANVSDARLKANVAPSTFDCLEAVGKLRLIEFDWIEFDRKEPDPWKLAEARAQAKPREREQPASNRFGLLAQEVAALMPEAVNPGDDFDDHLGAIASLNTNTMLALLVGAVQQVDARLRALEGHA